MVQTQYSDNFFVHENGRHYVAYHMLFLVRDIPGFRTFDFSESGNPNGERPIPGDADSAIISDVNHWWLGQPSDDWRYPSRSGHNSTPPPIPGWVVGYTSPFLDSNVLFGDGHVLTRYECENYVSTGPDDYIPIERGLL